MSVVFKFLSVFALLALTACSSIQTQTADDINLAAVFVEESQTQWPVKWWAAFNDAGLNKQVEQALNQNYSLQAAGARVSQTIAVSGQQQSSQIPELNANIGATRNWQESFAENVWSAGLSVSYELDLWGNINALVEQAIFNIDASQAAYRTLANTVAAQISSAWLGIRKENENLALLDSQKQRLKTALQIIERRQEKGVSVLSDVLQQQQLLESINADIIASEAQRQLYKQQLALWLGQDDNADFPKQGEFLPMLENKSTQTVSLSALKARPDVQQAYYQLQASNAGLAAAISNRYPRLSLSASYTGQDQSFEQLLNNLFSNWVASLAGSLVAPIIDGGQRQQEVSRQQALMQESLLDYQQTLLEAAQEVQQALVRKQQYQDTQLSLEQQLQLAQTALALSDRYYALGQLEYLALLNVQRDVLSLEQQLLNARWNSIQGQIELYRSVSHGYFDEP